VSLSYTVGPGGFVAGGRFYTPSWRRNQAANTWVEVPGNTLQSIDPEANPAINPNFPGTAPWRGVGGQAQVMGSWSGGDFDLQNDDLWVYGGGHADYAGNELYKVRIASDSADWLMVRPPTGAVGNEGVLDDGQELTGRYFDGRPRSTHSYNRPVYIPATGLAIGTLGNTYRVSEGTREFLQFDAAKGEPTYGPNAPFGNPTSSAAAYDSLRHCVYWRTSGTGAVQKYDLDTQEWSTVQTSGPTAGTVGSGDCGIEFAADLDCLFLIIGESTYRAMDCATGAMSSITLEGSPVGAVLRGSCRPRWVPNLRAFACWDNTTDTGVINLVSPPSENIFSSAWTVSQLPVTGSTVPTVKTQWGTFGRFFYSRKLNGFGVVNATNQPIYFYALD